MPAGRRVNSNDRDEQKEFGRFFETLVDANVVVLNTDAYSPMLAGGSVSPVRR
jgi:hypothetical protein